MRGADDARRAFEAGDWSSAHELLNQSAAQGQLAAEDFERLAVAAHLRGHDDEADAAWEAAQRAWTEEGDLDHAGRCAFWVGFGLMLRGEGARANGWFARGRRSVEHLGDASVARGYLHIPIAMEAVERGDGTAGTALWEQIHEVACRFGDSDLEAIGLLGRGEAAIVDGDLRAGLELLDEAMVAGTTSPVSPLTLGILYCAVVDACVHAFDLRRAAEWTEALAAWCDRGDVVPFRGECLVHRSQVLQASGDWEPALEQATTAQDLLDRARHPALGSACYQRAELHRLRGELDLAEEAYRAASAHGREPTPGLALLRLAKGQLAPAAAMVRRMHAEAVGAPARIAVLPAVVEVMLAAGDPDTARAAAHELTLLAASGGSGLLDALSAHATGSVLLATGDAAGAAAALRRAGATWRDLAMPYDAARSQELIGLACRTLGDDEGAELELAGAEATFAGLGAVGDAARVREHRQRGDADGAGRGADRTTGAELTERERDVLRHVAAGRTNREIGAALGISEHTAARHVQNIFTKLDLSSRAAATAHAYERGLL